MDNPITTFLPILLIAILLVAALVIFVQPASSISMKRES